MGLLLVKTASTTTRVHAYPGGYPELRNADSEAEHAHAPTVGSS